MNAITEMITQQLGASAVRKIAQRFGISETAAATAVQIGVPLIVAALARNASEPQGAERLHEAINNDHDGSILDNVVSYLGNPQSANGAGRLSSTYGSGQWQGSGSASSCAGSWTAERR